MNSTSNFAHNKMIIQLAYVSAARFVTWDESICEFLDEILAEFPQTQESTFVRRHINTCREVRPLDRSAKAS